jgi:peptide/nickel transport system substrate-binding protein
MTHLKSKRGAWIGFALLGLAAGLTVLLTPAIGAVTRSQAGSAAAPVAGGTLVMARPADVFSFDPANAPDPPSVSVVLTIYDRLVQFPRHGSQILPDLATSWKYSNNRRTVTFTLRNGVRFSDGSPLTADDVVFSIQRAVNPKGNYAVLWGGAVKRITKVDNLHVRIDLTHPYSPLLPSLGTFQASIVSERNWKKWGEKLAPQHPLGTGPFMLQRWDKGIQIVLLRNPNYWGRKQYLDKIVFKVVGDDNARVLQLESGAVDAIEMVPPSQAKSIEASGRHLVSVRGNSVFLIPLNEHVKPFQDRNVRLALSYALDSAAISKAAYFGLAPPARSAFPSGTLFYKPNYPLHYNLAKAKALLAKSSVPNGFSFTLLVPSGNAAYSTVAQIWSSSLKAIGVTAKIQNIEATTGFARWFSEKYQAYFQPWTNDTPDASEFTGLVFAGQDGFKTGYHSPIAAKLAAEGVSAFNPAQRQRVYSQVQRILARDVPSIYALDLPLVWATSAKVHGYFPNGAIGDYLFNNVWKSK